MNLSAGKQPATKSKLTPDQRTMVAALGLGVVAAWLLRPITDRFTARAQSELHSNLRKIKHPRPEGSFPTTAVTYAEDPNQKLPLPLGQMLIEDGLISPEQLEKALARQAEWGSRLGDVLLALGYIKPFDLYPVLARRLGLEFVNLLEQPADASLFEVSSYAQYAENLYLPWRVQDGILWIVTADPTSYFLKRRWGRNKDVRFAVTSRFDILWELQRVAGTQFSDDAVYSLANFAPEHSARIVVTPGQKW